jgi:hypothetical protein
MKPKFHTEYTKNLYKRLGKNEANEKIISKKVVGRMTLSTTREALG